MNTTTPTFALAPSTTTTPTKRPSPQELFDSLSLEQAQKIVNSRKNDQAQVNLDYFNGDHWRQGEGWVGPRAGNAQEAVGAATLAAIEKAFVSRNVISEVSKRHTNGVLGRQLHWKFTVSRQLKMVEEIDDSTGLTSYVKELPTPQEQALIDEAEAAMVAWWDAKGVDRVLKDMTISALNTKRGVLRLFVPPGERDENGNLPPADLAQALEYIHIQHLGTNENTLDIIIPSATVYVDPKSKQSIGVYTYQEQDDLLYDVGGGSEEQRGELTYIGEDGLTTMRIINQSGDIEEPITLPLNGNLTMYELARPWLITPQIISQQKSINQSMTMKQRNSILAGFLERIFSNVDWPGDWVDDPTMPKGKRFVPEPLPLGPSLSTNIRGLVDKDKETGKLTRAAPGVHYRDPVEPTTFIETEESCYLAILQEANQLHYAIAGDALASGESRKQARDAFTQDLRSTASEVEGAVRWMLETVLNMASYFANRPLAFADLRVYVQARIDSGPISPDEMRVAKEMKDSEMWSLETSQSYTGIEDVDAENARIRKEKSESMNLEAQAMAAAQKLLEGQEDEDGENPAPDRNQAQGPSSSSLRSINEEEEEEALGNES